MRRGEQREVPTPGVNRRINVFITMLWPSRRVIYSVRGRRRSREFREHLNGLLRHMRRHRVRRLILIMDNATIHRSRETKRFLERHEDRISPFYLPRYSPQLNEVEGRVNRQLKRDLCTNHAYQNIGELGDTARRYLRNHNKRHKQRDLT
jgi:transposase